MVGREEVVWLYRCILGREPESEDAVNDLRAAAANFEHARNIFLNSVEFTASRHLTLGYRPQGDYISAVKTAGKPLALVAIIKNEERHIEMMLRSVIPIIDLAVIADTGSTDRTRQIVEDVFADTSVPLIHEEIPFKDFASARNAALSFVPERIAWTLMLDGDEHLVPEDYWKLSALLGSDDVDGWALPRYNFADTEKVAATNPYPDYQRRLLRCRPSNPIRFQNAVHELPAGVNRWGYAPPAETDGSFSGGPHIHHPGAVKSRDETVAKMKFYERLAKEERGRAVTTQ